MFILLKKDFQSF